MAAFIEDPADAFDFDVDWLEVIGDNGAGSISLTHEAQESTRVGYVPANKKRSAARFFLGFAEADTDAPWRLRREQPHWDGEAPWLFAHSVTFTPIVPQSNASNPNKEPFDWSVFATDFNRYSKYKYCLCTVKFRAWRCLFLPDSAIATPQEEYKRNLQTTSSARLDVLSADGVSQLIFAETSAGGPTAGTTAFPAPVGVLLPKATFILEWLNVDRAYLSTNAYIFYPSKILSCVGTVNDAAFMGFPAGTLLLQPPVFVEHPWPVASEDADQIFYSILRSVTVQLQFDYFDPDPTAPNTNRGHNLYPFRANGKFYLATRDGAATTSTAFLKYTDFTKLFCHVSAP